jgi:allantoinase
MTPTQADLFPSGKRLALSVHFPVEWWPNPENEQVRASREYGARVGAWRLLDVFDRCGVRSTCHLNGMVAELFPALVGEMVKRGHDIAAHGYDQSHPQSAMSADEERPLVRKTLDMIESVAGFRPKGWVATGRKINEWTVQILAEEGLTWHNHHDSADLPRVVRLGERKIVDCPVLAYMHYSDLRFIGGRPGESPKSCGEMLDFFKSQIDALHGAAKHEPLCFQFGAHAHVSGRPAYAWVVEQMIRYASSFDDIWWVTTGELAERCLQRD